MQKIMVVAHGTVYVDELTGEDIFADYMAVLYPAELNPETTIFLIMRILIKFCSQDFLTMMKSGS